MKQASKGRPVIIHPVAGFVLVGFIATGLEIAGDLTAFQRTALWLVIAVGGVGAAMSLLRLRLDSNGTFRLGVAVLILFSILVFLSNAILNGTIEVIDHQNAAALKLWAGVQEMKEDDPTQVDKIFEQTVEFSRGNASLLHSARRLNELTPSWIELGDADVTFNDSNKGSFDHLSISAMITTAGDIKKEAEYQIRLYQEIRDFSLQIYKIYVLGLGFLSYFVLPVIYGLLGAFLSIRRVAARDSESKSPSTLTIAAYVIAAAGGLLVGGCGFFINGPIATFLIGWSIPIALFQFSLAVSAMTSVVAFLVGRVGPSLPRAVTR